MVVIQHLRLLIFWPALYARSTDMHPTYVARSMVCVSVCVLVTRVSCAKTA